MQYAGGGACKITDVSDEKKMRIRIVVEDHGGTGIANLELAMKDGYSTGGGLARVCPARAG